MELQHQRQWLLILGIVWIRLKICPYFIIETDASKEDWSAILKQKSSKYSSQSEEKAEWAYLS
jgi:hypothetical protein